MGDTQAKGAGQAGLSADARPIIKLVVSDLDNTLIDFFNSWAQITDRAVKALAKSRGLPQSRLMQEIKSFGGRFHGFHDLPRLIRELPCLKADNPAQQRHFHRLDAGIVARWNEGRRETAKAYPGVIETVRKIKSSGAKFVVYTDSPMHAALKRLMAANFPAELIDGVYARKDIDVRKARPLGVKSQLHAYKQAIGLDNLHEIPSDEFKPNPARMQKILADHNVSDPKHAVMIGDNIQSDGGGAVPLGMHYAWQKEGATMQPFTLEIYNVFSDKPSYKLGVSAQMEQQSDNNRPSHVLVRGFRDLPRMFRFQVRETKDKAHMPILKHRAALSRSWARERGQSYPAIAPQRLIRRGGR